MKKITLFLGAFLTLFFISCEGPEGPPGFDGFDGEDGLNGFDGEDGIQGQVFEVDGINFDYILADNIYETILTFSNHTSFEVIKEDAILVYRYDGPVDFMDGSSADSWGLIPQNFFITEGTIQYVPSHTLIDVNIIIDGNFNLSNLSTDFIDDQIFRIVIIPSKLAESAKMDTSNIKTVMQSLGLSEEHIIKIN